MTLQTTNGWHYLRQNHGTHAPASFLVFDTETIADPMNGDIYPQSQRLRLGVARYFRLEDGEVTREQNCVFRTAEEFHSFLSTKLDRVRPLWVWAHNLGFDLTIVEFWEWLERGEYVLQEGARTTTNETTGRVKKHKAWKGVAILNDPPTYLSCRRRNCMVHFCDTYNWLKVPLAAMGESLGLPKLAMPSPVAPEWEWLTYCKRDVDITVRAVQYIVNFVRENDLGCFRPTAPGQAFQAYRHRFMADKSILIHRDSTALPMERDAYYGGRCEVFFRGVVCRQGRRPPRTYQGKGTDGLPTLTGEIFHLDVRSLYPSVMHNSLFPCRLLRKDISPTLGHVRRFLNDYGAIAVVKIDSQGPSFPKRLDGITVHAKGRFLTCLCGPELLRAIDLGCVERLGTVCWYKMDRLFANYVDYFWALRLKHLEAQDSMRELLAKLFLNSLYGKFGQRNPEWEDKTELSYQAWGLWPQVQPGGETTKIFRSIAHHTQEQKSLNEHVDSFPAVAAYVTSYGRERLGALLLQAGHHNVYYCDTDSLYCNALAVANLTSAGEIVPGQLGKLRIVEKLDFCKFQGIKDYCKNDVEVISAVKRHAQKVADGTYEQLQFEGLKTIINRGPNGTVGVWKKRLALQRIYKHGRVTPSGWTEPLELAE